MASYWNSPQRLRNRKLQIIFAIIVFSGLAFSCATLPEPKYKRFDFPESAFVETPPEEKSYKILGVVRTRVDFSSMIQDKTEEELCANYYKKGARDLLYKARKNYDADAIMKIRTVVFYMDGKRELHNDPQCAEDEAGGQILLQAEAIQWTTPGKRVPVNRKKNAG